MADKAMEMLNSASAEDLAKIPGVDQNLAQAVVNYREEHGNFNSWEDLKDVPGVGDAVINGLKSMGGELGL